MELCHLVSALVAYESSSCSASSVSLGVVSLVHFRDLNTCTVVAHCGFKLCFPSGNGVEHFLICLFAIHISSLVSC